MAVISGNVGGTLGSGAVIHINNKRGTVVKKTVADGSGNHSVSLPDDTYIVRATLDGFIIRQQYEVVVRGVDVTALNFTISAINSKNQ